jgi:hypothetical protein
MVARSVAIMVGLLALGEAGCTGPSCGAGTKQVQDQHGNLSCVPAEVGANGIDCDADGGAVIVAGHCVSRTICGANTQPSPNPDGTISCIGVSGAAHQPPACPAPPSGSICVRGTVHHLADDSFLSGERVQVTAHDPIGFLTGDPSPLKDSAGKDALVDGVTDTFMIPDVRVPSNLFAITVGSPSGEDTLQLTACGASVANGQSYTIDCYATPKSLVTAWSQQSSIDYNANGAYVAFFFSDLVPSGTQLVDNETGPLAGVKLFQDSAVAPMVRYFGGSAGRGATTIDPTLMVSGTSGGAIVPNNAAIHVYTGKGGTYMGTPIDFWEATQGASAPSLVFVQRIHRCLTSSCM